MPKANPRVFSFHYSVSDASGEVLDSSEGAEPLLFMEGAGQIIPGLEVQITGLKAGDERQIQVAAKDAYGVRDEKLVVTVDKSQLPQSDVAVGDMFQAGDPGSPQVLTVTQVQGAQVTLDGNHPMAGKDLKFDIKMVEVREATKEEIEHGHAHEGDGHHHH